MLDNTYGDQWTCAAYLVLGGIFSGGLLIGLAVGAWLL